MRVALEVRQFVRMWKAAVPSNYYSSAKKGGVIEISLDEIYEMRNCPTSAKARACKTKILNAVMHDDVAWKQLQKEMRNANVHTNAAMGYLLNKSVLERVGIKMMENRYRNPLLSGKIESVVDSSKISINKSHRGTGSLQSIKTTMKALDQNEEFMSNLRGILSYCKGSVSLSTSLPVGTSKLPSRKGSLGANPTFKSSVGASPRSMSMNTTQQMNSSLASSQNLVLGSDIIFSNGSGRRRSFSSNVESRVMNSSLKKKNEEVGLLAGLPHDPNLRLVLEHALDETHVASRSTLVEGKPLLEDFPSSSQPVEKVKSSLASGKASEEVSACSNKEIQQELSSPDFRTPSAGVEVAYCLNQQGGGGVERGKESAKIDHRLRRGSTLILQNFSEREAKIPVEPKKAKRKKVMKERKRESQGGRQQPSKAMAA